MLTMFGIVLVENMDEYAVLLYGSIAVKCYA